MKNDDSSKSKQELIEELESLRTEIAILQNSEAENLATIIRDSGDGLLVINHSGTVLLANPAAEKILGRKAGSLFGKKLELPTTGPGKIEVDMVGAQGQMIPVELWTRETVWENEPVIRVSMRDLTEARAAQEVLRQREYELNAFFNQSLLFALVLDPEGTVVKMNNLCFEVCGDLAENTIGLPIWKAKFWDTSATLEEQTRLAVHKVQNGEKVRDEVSFLDKKRQICTGLRLFSPVFDDKGGLLLISLIGLDITENKRAEKEIRQNAEILRYIIKHDPNALAVYDNELKYIAVSDRYLDDYNVKETNVVGKHHYEVFPEIPERWRKIHRRVLQGHVETNLDDSFKRVDGSITFNRWECRPWYTIDGHIGGMITYTEVTTERKLAEQKLAQQKKLFETMFNTIPDGVVITDTNRVIVLSNRSMETIFGYSPDEIIGESTKILYADSEHFQKAGATVFNQKSSRTGTFYRTCYKTRNGREFPGETFGAKLYDSNGLWIGNLGIMRNITEQVNQTKENERLQRQLIQSQKMEAIGTLAGGIAHDFNNILSAILGFSEMALREAAPGEMLRADLEEIYSAGIRGRDLVQQILAFARKSDDERQPIQVSTIIKEVIKFLRSSIPTSIEITLDIQSESLILGSPTQIHQIVMNLCTNAVQAIKNEKGCLRLSIKDIVLDEGDVVHSELPIGDYLQLQVTDDGVGIAREHVNLIFEPYFTTKGLGEGTGLGLSQVYGIIQSYGGIVKVQSKVGKGSTFTILIPVFKGDTSDVGDEKDELPTGHESILVVDDEASITRFLNKQLTSLGYSVTTKTNSVEALEFFRSNSSELDLVLTDMTMPNMTGDELAAEISSMRPDIPIIICTGYSKKTSGKRASDLFADEILIKPIVQSDLARIVRELLDRKKLKETTRKRNGS
ncbi:PAS domain-containing hybrid sensor histidine kinase/response regulator [Desulfogranum japonicum]|uniref:PAS domain-containing hybrid sensor histidine kinase/response regulator n=1 Tax=Desulfogranum japonicum TaxID=231447 RepID=UPI0004066E94|nr:PAS domain S-box protein [Desulfogranum japonicum]